MGLKIHGQFDCVEEAMRLYARLRLRKANVELWKSKVDGKIKYVVASRTRGRNPNVGLLKEFGGSCPGCGGPAIAVWEKGKTKALKCLKGHPRRNIKGETELKHLVYLV